MSEPTARRKWWVNRWGLGLLIVVSLPAFIWAALVARVLIPTVFEHWWYPTSFEPVAWRQNVADNPMWPVRLRMVDDLLAGRHLHGLTLAEVEELLGPADHPGWEPWDLAYYLGPERGLIRIDSETLVVRAGPEGTVVECAILRD